MCGLGYWPAAVMNFRPTVRPRQGVSMSALVHPKTITVDGLSVRYAEGGQDGPDAILMSPWPESVYAFEPAWPHLAAAAHLIAIDPPGFGGSDYRQTLMNPKAMGHFILNVADALGLDNPHIVGPDIGTSSVLFAAAADQDRFRSIVVGSGGAAVPLDVTGVLKEWIEAPDLEPYRQIGGRKIVEIALGTIADRHDPRPGRARRHRQLATAPARRRVPALRTTGSYRRRNNSERRRPADVDQRGGDRRHPHGAALRGRGT